MLERVFPNCILHRTHSIMMNFAHLYKQTVFSLSFNAKQSGGFEHIPLVWLQSTSFTLAPCRIVILKHANTQNTFSHFAHLQQTVFSLSFNAKHAERWPALNLVNLLICPPTTNSVQFIFQCRTERWLWTYSEFVDILPTYNKQRLVYLSMQNRAI